MQTIKEIKNTMTSHLTVKYCAVDKLYYVYKNDEEIGYTAQAPTEAELIEMDWADNWEAVFTQMRNGKKARVSERIYQDMLGAVPPIKFNGSSFYCGECYSGNLYHYFEKQPDGKIYGQLKPLTP